jgi:hypothetical protein
MPRIGKPRRSIVVLAVALVGGVLVGSVIAAQRGGDSALDVASLQAAIATEPMTKVADVAGSDDSSARGVYVQELDTGQGHLCVWDAPSAASRERQGGCNSIDEPLGGSAVSANLAYDGGPAIEGVRDARLTGLAASNVASVVVLMSDGSQRSVHLKKAKLKAGDFFAFGYRFKKADLRKGVGPIAVIAQDAYGGEIARQPTGIGG